MAPNRLLKLVTTSLSWSVIGHALNTDDQTGSSVDYGTFEDPSSNVRPRFRYWIPDASVDLDIVADDLRKVKDVGMGGVELLGYYLYGNYPQQIEEGGPVPVDWTQYGWGTPAWKNLTDAALRATKSLGLIMDFTIGPNQGAGVPAEPDDEGIMWQLLPFNTTVPVGGTFDGVLPGWGSGQFVSASTGLVTSKTNATWYAAPAWQGQQYNGTRQILADASLADVTQMVDSTTGRLQLSLPNDVEGTGYQIFAYYQTRSTYLEQASPIDLNTNVPQSPVTTYVQNGSRVVDHFSAKGAKLITDFWEQHLLDGDTRDLIREVGNFAWEDSMEIGAGTIAWWTPGLLDSFRSNRGYDLNKYLPLIFSFNTEANGPLASPDRFYTDGDDQGQSYVNDYWQTLTDLNRDYLDILRDWSQETLQSQFSAQVSYNLPMDMLANIPSVNAPECESLGFDHVIDAYRQFSGPANLAGMRIISSELGAQRQEVYSQTLPELIWDTKRSVVGGVNNFIYHGMPYAGNYPNTTWPGYTTFSYRFSNMHGPRQPYWNHQKEFMDWTARTQWIAQSGTPKIDLAFWLKRNEYFDVPSVYDPNDLQDAGYSYEYLSPDNFMLPDAEVVDGVFAPERQAFKALILRGNDTLTVSGVQNLVAYAQAGLPIIFSGGIPQNLTGYNATGTEYVRSALSTIVSLGNVHVVPYDNLASSLQELGITPRTRVHSERVWNTYWREDSNVNVTYVYIYNDAWDSELGGGASKGSITFEATGVPYDYDAWTGDVKAIPAYQQSATTTTIEFSLAGNQTTIIGFHHNETVATGTRMLSAPPEVYGATPDETGHLVLAAGNATQPVLLSNGTMLSLPIPAAPVQLDEWSLIVESWAPPQNLEEDQTKPSLSNSTYNVTRLEPWGTISETLRNVSGRGIYTTTFEWPPSNGSADGAILNLGAIVNTAKAEINGQSLPPLDPTDARADLGEYLVDGTNTLEVVVTTTLGNVLRTVYEQVKSSGTLWLGPVPFEQDYGLVSNVTIVPYLRTVVAL
ncbi:hypothetical protein CB0940_00861 [Cercospora beticola]|uniref:Secreted protein n=1 Tax=Cercospora beticola TaxID=122368 RepID=A0A2G5I973_CERBT|nr:hypothetical protein CB0940_00861 [Cercospora beticola]PIB01064.1 hypothetical protein CB0940_00861 [Cercospora beticola]WPA96289.1 hypothetical protein RHO25_000895 [Cercospora beticola]CAK1355414.1 unnamed protein product [Cercospora beticola]